MEQDSQGLGEIQRFVLRRSRHQPSCTPESGQTAPHEGGWAAGIVGGQKGSRGGTWEWTAEGRAWDGAGGSAVGCTMGGALDNLNDRNHLNSDDLRSSSPQLLRSVPGGGEAQARDEGPELSGRSRNLGVRTMAERVTQASVGGAVKVGGGSRRCVTLSIHTPATHQNSEHTPQTGRRI